jgi:hypothetical protein
MQNRVIVLAVVVLAVVVLAVVFWRQAPEPGTEPEPQRIVDPAPPPPAPPAETAAPPTMEPEPTEPPPAPEPILVVPRLNDSDEFVRQQTLAAITDEVDIEAEDAAEPPLAFVSWLEREDLMRRFAVVVDNAAMGNIPRQQLDFLAPEGPFPVVRDNDDIFVDERGFARYDRFVDTVVRVSPERAADLMDLFSPLFSQALQELGYVHPEPRARLRAAIDHALATPVIEDRIQLVQPGVLYQYADPDLEALTPLQKQLMRMGPDNLRRLQAYLQDVRTALELE